MILYVFLSLLVSEDKVLKILNFSNNQVFASYFLCEKCMKTSLSSITRLVILSLSEGFVPSDIFFISL